MGVLLKEKKRKTLGDQFEKLLHSKRINCVSFAQVEAESSDHFIEVSITDHQKVGDGMGAYVLYKVSTHTNMPLFKKKDTAVMRRFSDFLGLHDKLTEKYLKCGRIIPPAPEKSVIGK